MKFKLILIFTLLLLASVPTQATDSNEDTTDVKPDATKKLIIATRHDSAIYLKYAAAFAASEYGQRVGITSADEIDFFAQSTYAGIKRLATDPSFGVSLVWGGGPTLFNNLIQDDGVSPITNSTLLSIIDDRVPDEIAGANMKQYSTNNELMWVANAISSFGFTVNHQELQERGLPVPRTWEDLASPDFYTSISQPNIGMGNAPDTTSNTRIYQIILQKFGWEKGWEMLYRMAGNSKIYGGSVETRSSVESGETAVAMTIDFYGLIAMATNPNTEYIVPENGSIVNGDPIALTKAPPHLAAAEAFMEFLFTDEGQALWLDTSINRMPVLSSAFNTTFAQSRADINNIADLYNKTINNKGITFDEDLALSFEETMRYHFQYTITNVHSKLVTVWDKIVNGLEQSAISERRFGQIAAEFGKPQITMQEAQAIEADMVGDNNFRLQKQAEWEAGKKSNLDRADQMLSEPETIISTSEITIVSNGSTIVSVSTGTSLSEAGSISQTYSDLPIPLIGLLIGIVIPVFTIRRKSRK